MTTNILLWKFAWKYGTMHQNLTRWSDAGSIGLVPPLTVQSYFHLGCLHARHRCHHHRLACVRHHPLMWRHNEPAGVSNHQPRDCLLNRLFGHRSKKTSKLRVTGLCAGNSPETGEFPAQMASNAENVSIWWRHHAPGLSAYSPLLPSSPAVSVCSSWSPGVLSCSSPSCSLGLSASSTLPPSCSPGVPPCSLSSPTCSPTMFACSSLSSLSSLGPSSLPSSSSLSPSCSLGLPACSPLPSWSLSLPSTPNKEHH